MQKIVYDTYMTPIIILIGFILFFNTIAFICMAYFMYKSTLDIAAFKKANDPWEFSAIADRNKEIVDKVLVNQSEQTNDSSFGTIPTDEKTLNSLRNTI